MFQDALAIATCLPAAIREFGLRRSRLQRRPLVSSCRIERERHMHIHMASYATSECNPNRIPRWNCATENRRSWQNAPLRQLLRKLENETGFMLHFHSSVLVCRPPKPGLTLISTDFRYTDSLKKSHCKAVSGSQQKMRPPCPCSSNQIRKQRKCCEPQR